MQKVLIAVLTLVGAGLFAQPALAKSICKQHRDACYAALGRTADKDAMDACDAEYERCIHGTSYLRASHPFVSQVPGLGTPMVKPYPTGAVPVNLAAVGAASGVQASQTSRTANVRTSKNVRPPQPTKTQRTSLRK